MPVLDATILLRASGATMNWEQLARWLGDDQATASLYLLLSCLSRHELASVPTGLLATLAARQTIIGRTENRIIQTMIDRYLLGGRSLRLVHSWHVWLNLLGPGARHAKSHAAAVANRVSALVPASLRFERSSQTARSPRPTLLAQSGSSDVTPNKRGGTISDVGSAQRARWSISLQAAGPRRPVHRRLRRPRGQRRPRPCNPGP